eukprot:2165237-Rhodomonas_salina.1
MHRMSVSDIVQDYSMHVCLGDGTAAQDGKSRVCPSVITAQRFPAPNITQRDHDDTALHSLEALLRSTSRSHLRSTSRRSADADPCGAQRKRADRRDEEAAGRAAGGAREGCGRDEEDRAARRGLAGQDARCPL